MNALSDFGIVTKRVNHILELLDPGVAAQYKKLEELVGEKLAYFRALHGVDLSLWHGRMVLFNLVTPPHQDTQNPPGEWTPLHAAGDFTEGGCLYIHELKLRLTSAERSSFCATSVLLRPIVTDTPLCPHIVPQHHRCSIKRLTGLLLSM